ncbi:hypothetical protein [Sansalvadorimonas verongulae]|uniref:hypothetical protein n=1 Tax=Sansalvadorimonas verongulae TaxID=2172824 RepID=UPI0012BD58E6|nr:hypothetical protein [Sansalvadorimonas verongulae]
MLKERAINTATYLLAFGVAFGAAILSLAMTQLDNALYEDDTSENAPQKAPENQ